MAGGAEQAPPVEIERTVKVRAIGTVAISRSAAAGIKFHKKCEASRTRGLRCLLLSGLCVETIVMHVTRTDLGTPAYPRSQLLSRTGAAGATGDKSAAGHGGPVESALDGANANWLSQLRSQPAVRPEVVAAARAAVASGEIYSRSAAEAAAAGFLQSTHSFPE